MSLTLDQVLRTGDGAEGDLRRATLWAMRSRRTAELANRPDADAWMGFATRNRVEPIVAHALADLGDSTEASRAAHSVSARRMEALLGALDEVSARLDTDGIALVALKNGGIARGIYPCAACCPMGDLDTLVERPRFRDAHRLVMECGYQLATRAEGVELAELEHGLESGGTEYVKQVGEHEIWLELQWRAVAGRWIRRDQEPDTGTLLARSVAIAGTKARLLSPEDNMLQVGLHTAKHSYMRAPGLRLHTDVDRLAEFAPPNWSVVAERAKELSIRDALYFSLALASALLGSEVPEAVLEDLRPPTWKVEAVARWVKRADVFEPDDRKFSRPGMMMFHALLYDSARGLVASMLDTDPRLLGPQHLPRNVKAGVRRMYDLATRYVR